MEERSPSGGFCICGKKIFYTEDEALHNIYVMVYYLKERLLHIYQCKIGWDTFWHIGHMMSYDRNEEEEYCYDAGWLDMDFFNSELERELEERL